MSLAKAGSFELLELLGEGGVGQVYSARDPVLGRQVAIKMLRHELSSDREFRDRFYGEAQRLGDLNHANITTLYGLHFVGDEPFMVMELVRGRTLKELREHVRRLPPRESLAALAQTLAGLAYAHRAGVIHRDIKPSNLMITDGGIVKIMDFGIARVRGSTHMTRAGQALLTPLYASPEQIRGEEVDERSDLYSLGVVFYEMLAGRPPFSAKSEYLLERAHLEDPPPPLAEQVPGLDPPIEAAVMRALAKDPEDRFASAEEFGRAVGARAIRGDAPDILQDFITAAFREAPADETRRISRTREPPAPPIPDPEDKNRFAASPPPSSTEGKGARAESSFPSQGQLARDLLREAPEEEALPADSARGERGGGAAAPIPEALSSPTSLPSPPLDPPVAARIRTEVSPSAAAFSRPRPRAPRRAAILGGVVLVLVLGLGYAGLRSWGWPPFAWLSAPRHIAAEEPPRRSNGPPRLPMVAPSGGSQAAPHPPPPPTPAVERPKTRSAAPAPPPKGVLPPSPKPPAAGTKIASVQPAKVQNPATRSAAPAPPSSRKPAAPVRIAVVEPPKGTPPKPAPPLGPSPFPRPKPDLAGFVTGAMSASMIKLGERWIELYGIDDATRNLRSHIEALKRYLAPAQGRVECYRKAPRKYQCYSGGRDLALLALRDGIARPARDAPAQYREAALRRVPRRRQP